MQLCNTIAAAGTLKRLNELAQPIIRPAIFTIHLVLKLLSATSTQYVFDRDVRAAQVALADLFKHEAPLGIRVHVLGSNSWWTRPWQALDEPPRFTRIALFPELAV